MQNAETSIAEAAQREKDAQRLVREAEERLKIAESKKAAKEEKKQRLLRMRGIPVSKKHLRKPSSVRGCQKLSRLLPLSKRRTCQTVRS